MRTARWLRRLALLFCALVLAVGLAAATLALFVATDAGQRRAAQWLAAALSDATYRVRVTRLQIGWPGEIGLSGVSVADGEGEWLAIDEIRLAWRPRELLRGRLAVDDLGAGTVDWRRLPGDDSESAVGQAALPSLPLGLKIAHFTVASLRLGPDVLGAAAVLRLEGALGAEDGDEVSSRLQIVRTDGSPAQAMIEAVLRPQARWLSLSVTAEEPAGGLLPTVLGVPGESFSLRVEGVGPLSSWKGKLGARFGDKPFLDIGITAAETPTLSIELAGQLDLSRHLPELSPPQLDLHARLASEDGTRWRIESSRWRLAWLEAAVSGEVDLAAPRVNLDFDARRLGQAPLPFLPPNSRLGAVTASGHLVGALDGPNLTMELHAESAELAPLTSRQIGLSARFRPAASLFDGALKGTLELSGTAAALRIADDNLAPLLDGSASWDAVLDINSRRGSIEAPHLHLTLAGLTVDGNAEHGLDTGVGNFGGAIALPDLSGVAAKAGIGLSGDAGFDAELRWNLKDALLSGTVKGRAEKLRPTDQRLAALLGPSLSLAADWQMDPEGRLTIPSAAIVGERFGMTGELALAPGGKRLEGRFRASVPELAPLAPLVGAGMQGRAEMTARLSGAPAAPAGTIELTVTKAALNGLALGTIGGKLDWTPMNGGIQGALAVSAAPPPGPLRLTAGFRRRDDQTVFEGLRLTGSGGLKVQGAVAIGDDGPTLTGNLSVEAADLAPWLKLAAIEGSGGMTGGLALSAQDGRQRIEGKGTLGRFRLRFGDNRVIEGERLALSLDGGWPPDDVGSQLWMRGDNLRLDGAVLRRLEVRASGSADALRFEVESEGRYRADFAIAAGGTLLRRGATVSIDLAHLDGRALETAVRLAQPARLRLSDDGIMVEPLRLVVGAGAIDLDGRLDRRSVALRVQATALSLAPLATLGAEVEGRLDGSLQLQGDWPTPVATAELYVDGVRWRGLDDYPPIAGRLSADWRDGRVGLQGRVDTGSDPPLRLTAALPLRVTVAPWAVLMPPQEPVSLAVAWQGDAAAIWRLLPYPVHRLEGALAVDLRVAGTVDRPAVDGSLTLSRGEYEHLEFGTLLRDLELRIVTDGTDTLRIAHLSARDGSGGRLSGQGEITFHDLNRLAYASTITLKDFYVIRRDDLSGRVDGTIEIAGAADGGLIKGKLTARSVEATLIDSLASDVVELDVVEVGGGRAASGAAEDAGRRFNLGLDLQIEIPNRAFLRGRGLDSEWAGEIKLTGTTIAPVVAGTLRAVRGRFTMLGKNFDLGSSTVEITTVKGETDALLNINATHGSSDLDVTITVTGSALKPTFAWSSRPALPRDEIIARLLFGKGTGQLSAFEALQLAGALAELSGRGPSAGSLLDRARRTLGVDTLRLSGDAAAAGGAKVEAGKYLSDKLYIGVEQGAAAGSSGARIELQVLPRVSVETQVQPSGANIGAKFRWDY